MTETGKRVILRNDASGAHLLPLKSFKSLLLAGTLGVVVSLSCLMLARLYVQTRAEMRLIAGAQLEQVANRAEARVGQLLAAAQMTAESAARQSSDRVLGAEEFVPFFMRLVSAFEQRPELTYLGYATTEKGEYALLERRPDGTIWLRIYMGNPYEPRVIHDFRWNGKDFQRQADPPPDFYDPRIRPFFTAVRREGAPVWTSIYRFLRRSTTDSAYGITDALPQFGPDGKLAAVWDADFDLHSLITFTRTLHEETGCLVAVLAEVDGRRRVITDPDVPAQIDPDVPPDWALRASIEAGFQPEHSFVFTVPGPFGLTVVSRQLGRGAGPDWDLMAAIPVTRVEAAFVQRRWARTCSRC